MKLIYLSLLLLISQSLLGNDTRPNILLFYADDWGRVAGTYADPDRPSVNDVVKTPAIDRLAREGVVFENAFMEVPLCSPNRASMATGCHFWRCGSEAFLRAPEFDALKQGDGVHDPLDDLPRFTQVLEDMGYLVASSYKTFIKECYSRNAKDVGDGRFNKRSSLYAYGVLPKVKGGIPPEQRLARVKEVEEQARGCVRNMLAARETPEQPFIYVFGPINTHRPWVQGSGKELWGIEPDDLKGKLPGYLPDVHDVREDFADYLGEIQALDMKLNAMVEELEKAGELDNTLILLTGDNGVPGVPRGKSQLYGLGVEAPLIVWWPGRIKPGRTVKDFVSSIDIAATFIEAAGGTVPEAMDSRSYLPQLLSEKSGWIDRERNWMIVGRERHSPDAREGNASYPARAVYTEHHAYIPNFKPDRWPMGDPQMNYKDCDGSPTKSYITNNQKGDAAEAYKLGFAQKPEEELYDLRRDPHQLVNEAHHPEKKAIAEKLRKRIMTVMKETGHPRLTDAFDAVPYCDPTFDIRTPKKKPARKKSTKR